MAVLRLISDGITVAETKPDTLPEALSTSPDAETNSRIETVAESAANLPGSTLNWQEQDEVLRNLWMQNLTPQAIADQLGRSMAAVMTRAARLGLPRRFAPGRKPGRRGPDTSAAAQTTNQAVATASDSAAKSLALLRVCLMCLKKFPSAGRHNRICLACKGSPQYEAGSRIPDITMGVEQ